MLTISSIDISCFAFGTQHHIPEHFSELTHYGFNRYCHVREGGTTYNDGESSVELEKGFVYLLPLKPYSLAPSTEERKYVHTWGHFLIKGCPFNQVLVINPDTNPKFKRYINLIDDIITSHSSPPTKGESYEHQSNITSNHPFFPPLSHLVSSFLEYFFLVEYNRQENGDNLDRVTAYINSNLGGDLSNEALCKKALYNKIYFIQKFTAKYNVSPQKYVLRSRISEAISMLMMDEKVEDIAFKLGYENSKSFSRAFKREMGLSPQNYKILHYYKIQ